MRFARTSGSSTTVWPCTMIAPWSSGAARKLVPNPEQVRLALPVDGDSGTDAGMHEGVVALDVVRQQGLQKFAVAWWQQALELFPQQRQAGSGSGPGRRGSAVAQQSGLPAGVEPFEPARGIVQEGEHPGVVVPPDEAGFEARGGVVQKQVDAPARIRPPVHIVAKQHQNLASASPASSRMRPSTRERARASPCTSPPPSAGLLAGGGADPSKGPLGAFLTDKPEAGCGIIGG